MDLTVEVKGERILILLKEKLPGALIFLITFPEK